MLTKNFYSYMKISFTTTNTEATFTMTNGTTASSLLYVQNPPFKVMNSWAKTITANGVSFGTGTTQSTASDYVLESILGDTQINVSVPSGISFNKFDTYEEYTVTFGVTNKTTEVITISEVGLTVPISGGSYALVDRTVLETPVTIPAGQSKQITYTIRFNYGG